MESNIFSLPLISLKSTKNLDISVIPRNPSGLCIVLNARFDTKEYHIFLEKVFQAVGLDLKSQVTKIVLSDSDRFSLSEHDEFPNIQRVIFFGVSPSDCGIHYFLPPYQLVSYHQRQYLLSDPLDTVMDAPNLKKSLWVALQQLIPKEL